MVSTLGKLATFAEFQSGIHRCRGIGDSLAARSVGSGDFEKTYELIVANYPDAFPKVVIYPQWVLQIRQLGGVISHLVTTANEAGIYLCHLSKEFLKRRRSYNLKEDNEMAILRER